MEKQKNKIAIKLLVTVSLLVLLFTGILLFLSWINSPLEVKVVDVRFEVGNGLGFELNNSALSFGVAFPGDSITRKMNIVNGRDYPVTIETYATASVAEYLTTENNIILQPGEQTSKAFVLNIPQNMSFGDYSGQVIIKIYKYTG